MPRIQAQVTTTSTNEVPVNGTTYAEQTVAAQRSLKSASANDAAAGTGVRTVRVTYYKLSSAGVMTGPFREIVTLNGATAVPMVETELMLVEKMEAVTVGSGGVAAGAITLYAAADGTGTAIAAIGIGDTATRFGHHYIPSGKRCLVTRVQSSCDGGVGPFALVAEAFPLATAPELRVSKDLPGLQDFTDAPRIVAGPARLRVLVAPDSADSQTSRVAIDFYEL